MNPWEADRGEFRSHLETEKVFVLYLLSVKLLSQFIQYEN